MTVLLVLVLAVMWGAVLLPPYLKDRRESVSGGGTALGERLSALTARMGGRAQYLPVRSGSLNAPQAPGQPLPAGARQQAMSTTAVAQTTAPEPRSSALQVLGPDSRSSGQPSSGQPASGQPSSGQPASGQPAPAGASAAAAAYARKRRRDVFFTLAAATGLSLVMAWALGGVVWGVHVLCLAALVSYAVLLVRRQSAQAERDIKVAFLPHGQGASATELLADGGGFDVPVQSASEPTGFRVVRQAN